MTPAEKWEKTILQAMATGGNYLFNFQNGRNALSGGNRVGKRAGNSLEFLEHREYRAGDDLRMVDWSVYARSKSWVVKRFQEEITPILDVVVDGSCSMLVPGTAKAEAALALAGFLLETGINSSYGSRLHILNATPGTVVKGCRQPREWLPFEFDATTSPVTLLHRLSPSLRNEGIRFFLSDLFYPDEPDALLRQLATGSSETVLIQITSHADLLPPMEGNMRLVDSENGDEMELLLTEDEVKRYKERLRRHVDSYEKSCRSLGVRFVQILAEEFLDSFRVDSLIGCGLLRHL